MAGAVAAVVALITLIVNFRNRKRDALRIKKQATLEAVAMLQNEVFDEMQLYSEKDVRLASEDPQCEGYKHFSTMLARCDHFAIGVDMDIYDRDTAMRLCGDYLWPMYKKFIPLVEQKRIMSNGGELYTTFQNVAAEFKNRTTCKGV